MLLENAIKRILAVPDGWVRVEQVTNIPGGLELCFGIHHGRRGKTVAAWAVQCLRVHEVKITDLDGGGIALSGTDHPAAKQYATRRSELRWPRNSNLAAVFTTLFDAHIDTTDDWVPFECYVFPNMPYARGFESRSANENACRGPDFLIRAYAKALRMKGETVRVIRLNAGTKTRARPKVLHFGTSYVVAEGFTAERESPPLDSRKTGAV
jgi:hypothetical protein